MMFRNITLFLLYSWSISVGYAQKNRLFQHKDIKKILPTHQSIAILPFKVMIEQGGKRSEDSTAYTLSQEALQEGYNIPFTCTFLWVKLAREDSPRLQSWDKTRERLAQRNYKPKEHILADTLQKIASALQVDALMVGTVQLYEDKYTTNFGKTHFESEEIITIFLSIYDGKTGELIWQNEDSSAYSLRLEEKVSLGKNTEIILARIFERVPYFQGKKKKQKK